MSRDFRHDGSKSVKCIGRYVLCNKTLGKGNFARVELATHSLISNKVAVKVIDMNNIRDEYVRRNLFREARLLRKLAHPNIIKLYETIKYTTQSHTLYCLVMELAEGGELLTYVKNNNEHKRLEESKARPFVRQLISALYYLHSKGVVHRDLKMENILLNKKKTEVKIIDFGLSNHHEAGELLSTHCGSPEYAAPELFVAGRQYGAEVDVWSLGVNMYAMLVGKLPFRSSRNHSNPRAKLLQQITAGLGAHQESDAAHLHPSCLNLIKGMLQPDPSKRLKLTAVMQHPWVTNKGTWPLYPYIQPKANEKLENQVIQQISRLLKVNQTDIRKAVDDNRLDWISAIYHLLMREKEHHLLTKQSNTSLSGEMTESTSGVGTSIGDEQESRTIEQIVALSIKDTPPATPKPRKGSDSRSGIKSASQRHSVGTISNPNNHRPKTAQVAERVVQSQPATPEVNRAGRAVSSMSYKIQQPNDTTMFTMPKIGRSARHIAAKISSPLTQPRTHHEYGGGGGGGRDKRRIENGYSTIPGHRASDKRAEQAYKSNNLIDTQKILNHIYKSQNRNGRTYVINGKSADQIERKMSAPCKTPTDREHHHANTTKPRYYMSGKRATDLRIDTSDVQHSPKSALTRLVEEKYIDQKHAWSYHRGGSGGGGGGGGGKKAEDSWATRTGKIDKNSELPNISQKACASQVSKQLHLLRQRLQQAREEYNVK